MKQKKPKCIFCNEKIDGEVAYSCTKPYHSECLKKKKIIKHNEKVRKRLKKHRKKMREEYSKRRSDRIKQWIGIREEVRLNGIKY